LACALRLVASAAAGYLLGTVPSAAVAGRLARGGAGDPRAAGSGNPGALNVGRLLGRRAGAVVAAADVAKGVAACAVGRRVASDSGAHVGGVAAVAGHCFPVWSGFEGGKGVATSFGQCLYTFPVYAPLDAALAVTVARARWVRRPSLASVAVASTAWIAVSFVWWRRRWPNLWGPPATAALPAANAATVAVLASRAAAGLARGGVDEYARRR
jgi:acyl phosphate:glycerol-3-phosphate acyltransferase